MCRFKSSTCFQFDKHNTTDDQIGVIRANYLSVEPNGNGNLLPEFNPTFLQGQGHCFFINFFKKSETKFVVNLIENADDLLGQF